MIPTDKTFVRNWAGYISRNAAALSDALDGEVPGNVFVENLAYHFAQMALYNLRKASTDDEETAAQLVYYASLGLMKGAADALATLDYQHLRINDKRKN